MKYQQPTMEIDLFEIRDIVKTSLTSGSGGNDELDPYNFIE